MTVTVGPGFPTTTAASTAGAQATSAWMQEDLKRKAPLSRGLSRRPVRHRSLHAAAFCALRRPATPRAPSPETSSHTPAGSGTGDGASLNSVGDTGPPSARVTPLVDQVDVAIRIHRHALDARAQGCQVEHPQYLPVRVVSSSTFDSWLSTSRFCADDVPANAGNAGQRGHIRQIQQARPRGRREIRDRGRPGTEVDGRGRAGASVSSPSRRRSHRSAGRTRCPRGRRCRRCAGQPDWSRPVLPDPSCATAAPASSAIPCHRRST